MPERERRLQLCDPVPRIPKQTRRTRQADAFTTPAEFLYVQRELPGIDADEPSYTFDDERAQRLQEALAAYNLDSVTLRDLAAQGSDLFQALRSGAAPPEVYELLAALTALLRP